MFRTTKCSPTTPILGKTAAKIKCDLLEASAVVYPFLPGSTQSSIHPSLLHPTLSPSNPPSIQSYIPPFSLSFILLLLKHTSHTTKDLGFSLFTMLGNQHHYLLPEYSIIPKRNPLQTHYSQQSSRLNLFQRGQRQRGTGAQEYANNSAPYLEWVACPEPLILVDELVFSLRSSALLNAMLLSVAIFTQAWLCPIRSALPCPIQLHFGKGARSMGPPPVPSPPLSLRMCAPTSQASLVL